MTIPWHTFFVQVYLRTRNPPLSEEVESIYHVEQEFQGKWRERSLLGLLTKPWRFQSSKNVTIVNVNSSQPRHSIYCTSCSETSLLLSDMCIRFPAMTSNHIVRRQEGDNHADTNGIGSLKLHMDCIMTTVVRADATGQLNDCDDCVVKEHCSHPRVSSGRVLGDS